MRLSKILPYLNARTSPCVIQFCHGIQEVSYGIVSCAEYCSLWVGGSHLRAVRPAPLNPHGQVSYGHRRKHLTFETSGFEVSSLGEAQRLEPLLKPRTRQPPELPRQAPPAKPSSPKSPQSRLSRPQSPHRTRSHTLNTTVPPSSRQILRPVGAEQTAGLLVQTGHFFQGCRFRLGQPHLRRQSLTYTKGAQHSSALVLCNKAA